MDSKQHILVVDDDPEIRGLVQEYLTEEGFRVSEAANGEAMYRILDKEPVDLLILDVRLPDSDGLTLASELHWRQSIGILMLSSKNGLVDKVAGLEVGADDYVTKPFHLRELLARVRSVLRRRELVRENSHEYRDPAKKTATTVRFGECVLDLDTRQIVRASGEEVHLSNGEFELLSAFLDNPRRVLSRDQLLDLARGRQAALYDRSIDVQVGRLRRKLENNPQQPQIIKTVHGAGYIFSAEIQRV